jgi:cullin 1
MKYVLLEINANMWAQKQNAEGMEAEDQVFFNLHAKLMMTKIIEIVSKHQLTNFMQELLSKYASLKLE